MQVLYIQNITKITQFDRHKIVILHQQWDSSKGIRQIFGISRHVEPLKNLNKFDKWTTKERSLKSLSTIDEQCLKVISVRHL